MSAESILRLLGAKFREKAGQEEAAGRCGHTLGRISEAITETADELSERFIAEAGGQLKCSCGADQPARGSKCASCKRSYP